MRIAGIDPGKSGGIVVLDLQTKGIEYLGPLPYIGGDVAVHELQDILASCGSSVTDCFIERVHAMPNQGVVSMFTFGKGFGRLTATAELACNAVLLVRPQDWKKQAGLSGKKKEAAVELFLQEQPQYKGEFNKATLSGIADAYFIAKYGANSY